LSASIERSTQVSITCQICSTEFSTQITNSHLRKHNITTTQYRELYGKDSISCSEYRKRLGENRIGENNPNFGNSWTEEQRKHMSDQKIGLEPWNKGKTYSASEKQKESYRLREEKYKSGELIRNHVVWSDEQKAHLGAKTIEFAKNNPESMKLRAQKAVQTKIERGTDLGKSMRGKKHTEKTLAIMKESRTRGNKKRTAKSYTDLLEAIPKTNCEFLSLIKPYVSLRCNSCSHEFTLTKQCFTPSKFKTDVCPVCYPRVYYKRSQGEISLFAFVYSLDNSALSNVTTLINNKIEADIYLPNQNICIEYNGLYWHSESLLESLGKSKTSDYEKRLKFIDKGIGYVSIFEDEWLNKPEIVKSRIANLLGKTQNTIFARKCKIKEVSSTDASNFCESNHIQGKGRSNIRYGLYHENELVSLMTFSKSNLSRKISDWEINRFCSKLNTNVVGGANKLFKHFIREHNPNIIVSYSDNRWSTGGLYKTLGFEFSHGTKPNYWYLVSNQIKRIHRFVLRKTKADDQSLTEMQNRDKQGFMRIWDCGSTKWIWKRPE